MVKIPKFRLYGEKDAAIEHAIQPALALRSWGDLSKLEKETMLQDMENRAFLVPSEELVQTIEYLNHVYLRLCPGKKLHRLPLGAHRSDRRETAKGDFETIFLTEKSEPLVLRMLSKFAEASIDQVAYAAAQKTDDDSERNAHIARAFGALDFLALHLNHMFEQFAVNQLLTRSGFVPRQDRKITEEIYKPTMMVLAHPKWKTVGDDLAKMFEDYREQNYPEVITKAHAVVQRFLQVLVGEEGKSGQGELAKLFAKAKAQGIIPANRFTEPLVGVIQGYIPSERATNSTAKPAMKDTSSSDALLMMNVVMVFLQFCLANAKG